MTEYKNLPSLRPGWFGSYGIEDQHGRWWRNLRGHYWMKFGPVVDEAEGQRSVGVMIGGEWLHGCQTPGGLYLKVSTSGEETLDVAYGLGRILRHYWKLEVDRHGGTATKQGRTFTTRRAVRLPSARVVVELGLTNLRWCFGPDDHGWSSVAPLSDRLRRNNVRWFRGGWRQRHTQTVKVVETEIPLPERRYPVRVELHRSEWGVEVGPLWMIRRSDPKKKRIIGPRFWVPTLRRIRWSTNVVAPEGLPVPGKGENSWDCGPDAVYESSGPLNRPPFDEHDREWVGEAIADVIRSVLRTRLRHGRSVSDTGA